MVLTRSRKRQVDAAALAERPEEGETDNHVMNKEEAETRLEEAKLSKRLKKKKQRQEAWARAHPPMVEILPLELITQILLCVENPETIYAFSKCSKLCQRAVTSEVIIRSAILAGGKSRTTMGKVMELVQKNAIYPPTVPRLLRLVNAKCCERMSSCQQYNLETETSQKVKRGDRPFGLAICPSCTSHLGTNIPYYQWNDSAFANMDFLAHEWRTMIRETETQTEHFTGDRIGPILSAQLVKQALFTYRGGNSLDENKEKQKLLLKTRHDHIMKDIDSDYVAKIVDEFLTAQSEYDQFQQSKKDLEESKRIAKQSAAAEKKKTKVEPVLQRLRDELDASRHSTLILSGAYDEYGFFKFHNGPAAVFLSRIVNAPSYATKKKVRECAQEVRDFFNLMNQNGFLPGGNRPLHSLSANQDSCSKALYRYCRADVSLVLNVKNEYNPYARFERFVAAVRAGDYARAVFIALDHELAATAFANRMTRNVHDSILKSKLHKLAMNVVRRHRDAHYGSNWTFTRFQECPAKYSRLSRNFLEYRNKAATRAFLRQPENGVRNYSREDAVDSILELGNQRQLLQSGQYEALLAHHRRCHSAGRTLHW